MKSRSSFIMKFVYSHNVIMHWNKMKPLLLMLHFTPAVNTTVTRENKTRRCPWQRHIDAGAVYIMKRRDRMNLFPEIWVIKMNWSVISHFLYFLLAPPLYSISAIHMCEHSLPKLLAFWQIQVSLCCSRLQHCGPRKFIWIWKYPFVMEK